MLDYRRMRYFGQLIQEPSSLLYLMQIEYVHITETVLGVKISVHADLRIVPQTYTFLLLDLQVPICNHESVWLRGTDLCPMEIAFTVST